MHAPVQTSFGFASTADQVIEDCNEATTVTRRPADYRGVAHYAVNPSNAERLWEVAASLVS